VSIRIDKKKCLRDDGRYVPHCISHSCPKLYTRLDNLTLLERIRRLIMSGYESESSASEDGYTETNVLLGYASNESTDDTISQLGGHPV